MKNISAILKKMRKTPPPLKKKYSRYIPSAFLRTVHNTDEDFAKVENLFDTAQKSLFDVQFNDKIFTSKLLLASAMSLNNLRINLNSVSNDMKKVADESEMRECGKKFVERFNTND